MNDNFIPPIPELPEISPEERTRVIELLHFISHKLIDSITSIWPTPEEMAIWMITYQQSEEGDDNILAEALISLVSAHNILHQVVIDMLRLEDIHDVPSQDEMRSDAWVKDLIKDSDIGDDDGKEKKPPPEEEDPKTDSSSSD